MQSGVFHHNPPVSALLSPWSPEPARDAQPRCTKDTAVYGAAGVIWAKITHKGKRVRPWCDSNLRPSRQQPKI